MKAQVIIDDKEWEAYKKGFSVAKNRHAPSDPPSFPVLVISHVQPADYAPPDTMEAIHCFVEAHDFKRLLGLA
jgi:hypothetical protein